ncbi:MAG: formate dehydrogenase accessory sulfurtransferase FdhD [Anaerolineales bacterium]|nr:formate dehydrogenase accessory sulfurtransferase FdhD [Anaerolineales bacterium]
MSDGAVSAEWFEVRDGFQLQQGEVINESLISIYVNGRELATMMATPRDQEALAIGFLTNEGFLEDPGAIDHIYLSKNGCCADVWLKHVIDEPERKIITSGCGGGITFRDPETELPSLDRSFKVDAERIFDWLNGLQHAESLYARARGVHAAGWSDGKELRASAEDVGRHNTVDKLLGICLQAGIETQGGVLLVTGRISSEMLMKSVSMGCPVVASRNSPTSLSVELARKFGVTLIGYVRRNTMRVYAHPERLQVGGATITGDELPDRL